MDLLLILNLGFGIGDLGVKERGGILANPKS
jgi:hypothetical protein